MHFSGLIPCSIVLLLSHVINTKVTTTVSVSCVYKLPVTSHAAHFFKRTVKVATMSSSVVLTLIVGVCVASQFLCDAHGADDEPTTCDGNCTCIRDFAELQSYIVENKTVLNRIVETFLKTGKVLSNFVKIQYDFEISENIINETTDEKDVICAKHRDVYFWSSSPLYLLGPKPLFFSTLFAVDVAEENVTISLPCLCKDVHGSFLSRLTYMVNDISN